MTKEEKIVSTALYISINTNASEKHITCSEIIQALYALEKHDITKVNIDELAENIVEKWIANDISIDDEIYDYVYEYLSVEDFSEVTGIALIDRDVETAKEFVAEKLREEAEEIQYFNAIYDLVGGKEAARSLLKIADIEIGEADKNNPKTEKQCKEIMVKW